MKMSLMNDSDLDALKAEIAKEKNRREDLVNKERNKESKAIAKIPEIKRLKQEYAKINEPFTISVKTVETVYINFYVDEMNNKIDYECDDYDHYNAYDDNQNYNKNKDLKKEIAARTKNFNKILEEVKKVATQHQISEGRIMDYIRDYY